jgi:nucleolar complex protein 2
MPQAKATKKFEKRHLKDTLERRKGVKKIKQRQQLKTKKRARKAEDNARPTEPGEKKANGVGNSGKASKDLFNEMSVDDFFAGGFDIPEMPTKKEKAGSKRKRDESEDGSEDDNEFESKPVPSGSEGETDEEDDVNGHMRQLHALEETDPEFHKYLQENEPELLDMDLDGGSDDLSGEGEDEDESEPKKKKQKRHEQTSDDEILEDGSKNELVPATVTKWRTALEEQHSLRAAREVVQAFRSAAHVSDEVEEQNFKYSISDPNVYHELLTLALDRIPEVFQHHLPVQEGKNGKMHVSTESKKFKTLAPLLRSQIGSIVHLLDHLSDASTLRLTLSSTLPLLPYLLSFKKLLRSLVKAVMDVWASSTQTEATRIAAFLILRRLTVLGDPGIKEVVLKSAYQGLVKGSRNTTVHTIAGVNLMKNSGAELWGLAAQKDGGGVAYTTAFAFIRQLAIHLRTSIQHNANDAYKTIYNWQYVHSLDFWSRVLSAHCTTPDASLRPLIYPLVQVTLGALRLIPTATYFPLRFQLTRSLLRLSRATNTYIPLAAPLYEVLNSAELRKTPKPSTLKPLEFATNIRAPKGYLKTRTYQDGVGEQVQELVAEFFALWSKNIAFPELALAPTVMLKRWLKDANNRIPGKGNKNQKVNQMIALLVQKVEANAKFVEEKRAKVEFAPNNRKQVEAFLAELEWEKTPVGAFVVGMRKQREEREKVAAEGRAEEEQRRKREKKSVQGVVEDDSDDGDEE